MTGSHISNILNHLSYAAVSSAVAACVGNLGAHLVVHIAADAQVNPRIGMVVGAVAGAITGLFFTKDANLSSKLVGEAALIFVPFALCKRFEISAIKTVIALSITSAVLTRLVLYKLSHQ